MLLEQMVFQVDRKLCGAVMEQEEGEEDGCLDKSIITSIENANKACQIRSEG